MAPPNEDGKDKVLEKALNHISSSRIKGTVRENKKTLVRALVKKDQTLLERVRFVIECMRTEESFEPTDDVLTENERTRLLTIDKKVIIEEKPGCFKATVNINDNVLTGNSYKMIYAKNEAILEAYRFLENLTGQRESQSRSRSPEGAAAVVQTTSSGQSFKTGAEVINLIGIDPLKLYKEKFLATYSKYDTALKYPSIVWFKMTNSNFPIETTESDTCAFISSISYGGKVFNERSSDRDKSRHKVASTAMRQLWGVDCEFWKEFFESDKMETKATEVKKVLESQTKEKREAIESYKKRALGKNFSEKFS